MSHKRTVTEEDIVAIRELLDATQARVLAPADADYLESIRSWSRAAEKPAGVTVLPSSADDVSKIVKYASDNSIDLAVKGGGHSTSGASSTHGGILLNLKSMRTVRVDAEKRLIYAQGGCLWMDVDAEAWKHGLATVGGTVADTGIGGLTLGGGYGHLTGKYGLVIDNVVEVTTVVANGEIIRSNARENQDLFWAILGAGQNMGVTTEFVFRAYPQQDVFAGTLAFLPTPENISKIVQAANDLYRVDQSSGEPTCKAGGQTASLLAFVKPPDAGGQTILLLVLTCMGSEELGRALFKPFFDVGPIGDTMAVHPYPKVNNLLPNMQDMRSSMKGAATVLPIRPQFVQEILAKYDDFVGANTNAAASIIAFEFYDASVVVSKDSGCFANRGTHLNSLIMPSWTKVENDQICRQWARDMSIMFKAELEAHGEKAGKGIDGGIGIRGHKGAVLLYGNYDQYDELSKDIFGENYGRLQSIKRKYDPQNLFNKLFPIQPAA